MHLYIHTYIYTYILHTNLGTSPNICKPNILIPTANALYCSYTDNIITIFTEAADKNIQNIPKNIVIRYNILLQ